MRQSINLDRDAINNIKLLNELCDNIDEYQLVVNGNIISRSEDDNYDGLFSLRELEYPIYFSFHQIMNSIRYSNLYKIEGYNTNNLIHLLDDSIDKVVEILEKTEDDPRNNVLCKIIEDIDDKYLILSERNNTCSFWKVYETFNDYLDTFSETLLECKRYLYISSHYSPAVDAVNNETGETNPNLVYSDDELEDEEDEEDEEVDEEFFKKVN